MTSKSWSNKIAILKVQLQSPSSSSSPSWGGGMPKWYLIRSRRVSIRPNQYSISSKRVNSHCQFDYGSGGGDAVVEGPASSWPCLTFCPLSRIVRGMFSVPIPRRQRVETYNSVLGVTNSCCIPCKLTSKFSNTKESRRGNANLNDVALRLTVDLMWLIMMFGKSIGGVPPIMKHVVKKVDVTFADLRMPRLLGHDIVCYHVDNEMMARFEDTRQHCLLPWGPKLLVVKTKSSHGMWWIPPPIWCNKTLL